jgi:hypothetical protein
MAVSAANRARFRINSSGAEQTGANASRERETLQRGAYPRPQATANSILAKKGGH